MEKIDQVPQERNLVDFTQTAENYSEDNQQKIRISNGINLKDLRDEGIVFDPEIPDRERWRREEEKEYFTQHTAELQRVLAERREVQHGEDGDGIDEEGGSSEFDELRKNMRAVTEDGGVQKKVIREGFQTGGVVPEGATVTLHYSQSLEGQDEPFDSSVLRGKQERYKLGEGQLIEGLEVGIKTMAKNEKAQFMINHNYGYGRFGCPPRIPEQATILATVEVVDFVEEGQAEAFLAMDIRERNKKHVYPEIEKVARIEHVNGNTYVSKEEWRQAVKHYERGVKLLEETSLRDEEEEKRRQHLMLKLQLNVAYCAIKLKWPKKACIACREALNIEENNTKALFRFGKAQRMLEDFKKARHYLVRAQRNKPGDVHINEELLSLDDQMAREVDTERMLCQGMFGNHKKLEEKRGEVESNFYENFLAELKGFQGDPGKELALPNQWSRVEMRALVAAAESLNMKVVEEEKRVRVVKECGVEN